METVAVVGLGYVGEVLLRALSNAGYPLIGYDINSDRIDTLRSSFAHAQLSTDPGTLRAASIIIITVSTDIRADGAPDLHALSAALRSVGSHMGKGALVIIESTVPPGTTETLCAQLLENASGLTWKKDFHLGYSPERINPGDAPERFSAIAKIIAGDSASTTARMQAFYSSILTADVHTAASIRTAEMAKLLENTQRTLNIALMNECTMLCHALGISMDEVLLAARSKWNFLTFSPGLAGGPCLPVNAAFLTHAAIAAGTAASLIESAGRVNNDMIHWLERRCFELLPTHPQPLITLMGVTYKENVAVLKGSKIPQLATTLRAHGARVQLHDPLLPADTTARDALEPADLVVCLVGHASFVCMPMPEWKSLLRNNGAIFDIKGLLNRQDAMRHGITLHRL